MCTPITTTLQLLSTTLVISISIIKLGSGKELKSIELKHIWAQKYLHQPISVKLCLDKRFVVFAWFNLAVS